MRRAVRAIVFRDNTLLVMKRDKFGRHYFTLPGGGIEMGESADHALAREMQEETGLQLGDARLVFVEDAGEIYGTQYIYLVNYVGGEPKLDPSSIEAMIMKDGKNLYEPAWLPLSELPEAAFISERLKQALLQAVRSGFPAQPTTI